MSEKIQSMKPDAGSPESAEIRTAVKTDMPALWREIGLSLIDSAQDSIYLIDRKCRYIFVNRAHLERLGLSLDEVVGRAYADFHSETQMMELKNKVDEALAAGESVQYEHTSVRDGKCFLRTFSSVINPASRDILGVLISSKDISDIVKTKREIDYFEKLTDAIGDGILTISYPERKIDYVNQAVQTMFGYSLKYMKDMPVKSLYATEAAFLESKKLLSDAAMQAGKIVRYESLFKRSDGEVFPAQVTTTFVRTEDRPVSTITIIQDITARKNAENESRESEMLYRAVAENALCGIFIFREGKYQYLNPYALAYTGYTSEELIGRDVFSMVHPDDVEALKILADKMLRGETDEPYEYRFFRKDGRVEWVTGRVSFITYKGERAILGITTDITSLKNTEIALKESEMRYRAVAESAQVGIYISQRRKFKYVNSYVVASTGFSHEELIDRDPDILVHPDDRADTEEKTINMLKGVSDEPYEHRCINKDGRITWITGRVALIDYQGKRAVLGTTMDITNLKMMQKDLEDARHLLVQSEKYAAIGKLATGVAHEILNPINIISMQVQILEMTETLSEKVKNAHKNCLAQIDRIVKIAKDLNQFSRISAKSSPKQEDLKEVIDQVLSLSAPRLKSEGIVVETRIGTESFQINLDRTSMGQAFFSIINNAIDAVKEKQKKELHITISSAASNREPAARIVFADNGTGISKQDLLRVFDPFYTTKEPGKGTGLGLSLCYGIIRDHGGRIWAENNEMGGASFVIELPMQQSGSAKPFQQRSQSMKRILVVDDEEQIAFFLSEFLKTKGYEVYVAMDGRSALQEVKSKKPHVVLLDIMMPGLSGIDVLKEIRKIDPEIGVIMATALMDKDLAKSALEMGAYDYITKPFDLDYLETAVMTKVIELCN